MVPKSYRQIIRDVVAGDAVLHLGDSVRFSYCPNTDRHYVYLTQRVLRCLMQDHPNFAEHVEEHYPEIYYEALLED